MTIYLAYATIDYEGIYTPSMRVFSTKEKAEQYVAELKDKRIVDAQEIREMELDDLEKTPTLVKITEPVLAESGAN